MAAVDAIRSKLSRLHIGRTSASTKVEFTARTGGTGDIATTEVQAVIPVPNRQGAPASQLGQFVARGMTFACVSNSAYAAVLRDAFAQRRYVTWQPEGTGSGLPQLKGEAIVSRWVKTYTPGGIVR